MDTAFGNQLIMVLLGRMLLLSNGQVCLNEDLGCLFNFLRGTYFQNASSSYTSDPVGIAWVTFDSSTGTKGSATPRIFVGA